jgi:hypothetical protein
MKLCASDAGLVNVAVKDGKMILHGPDKESETGKEFYEGDDIDKLLSKLETAVDGQFKVVKEKKRVKFVVMGVENLDDALKKLQSLMQSKPTLAPIVQ